MLLYAYANVMQQLDSSCCGLFTIADATDIAFELNPEIFLFTMSNKCNHICITT
jgi:hypothetical protein